MVYLIPVFAVCFVGLAAKLVLHGSRLAWVALLVSAFSLMFAGTLVGFMALLNAFFILVMSILEILVRRGTQGRRTHTGPR